MDGSGSSCSGGGMDESDTREYVYLTVYGGWMSGVASHSMHGMCGWLAGWRPQE